MSTAPEVAVYTSDGYLSIPGGLFGNRGLFETGPLRARFKLLGDELAVFDFPALPPRQAHTWNTFRRRVPNLNPNIHYLVEMVVEEVDGRTECDALNNRIFFLVRQR